MAALLGLCRRPVVVAPMAGGPSTVGLVVAAAEAGALGFLAAGYKRASEVEAQIAAVRSATTGPFGVNLFVPGAPTADPTRLDRYLRELAPDAAALEVELGPAAWDDDDWAAKIDLLVDAAPPVVSFAFGCPPASLIEALQQRETLVMVTVTTPAEARMAADAGADALCVQGAEAGAHRGSFADDPAAGALGTLELLAAVRQAVDAPLVAAGGIALPEDAGAALGAGAAGVQAGTAFLRCTESGAHPVHKDALVDERFAATDVTRSFSGRRARGLVNSFMRRHPAAPVAYPEINNATRPLRAAAARRGDGEHMSLWAGTGHRHARAATAGAIVEWLASGDPAAGGPG